MAYIQAASIPAIIVLIVVIVFVSPNYGSWLKSYTDRNQTKIYRVYTGPLAHLPGPAISKWTGLVLQRHLFAGDRPRYVQNLHKKYGRRSRLELSIFIKTKLIVF